MCKYIYYSYLTLFDIKKKDSSRTGWRDAGRDGPHPKNSPGRGPLAAVPPGGHGMLPWSEVEAVPYGGCYADP